MIIFVICGKTGESDVFISLMTNSTRFLNEYLIKGLDGFRKEKNLGCDQKDKLKK